MQQKNGTLAQLCVSLLTGILLCASCKPASGPQPASPPSIPVETIIATPERVEETITVVGTLFSNESVNIKPEVSGKIASIGFEEGQFVEQGAVLFRLDTELLDAEYQEVKANFNFAESQYQRAGKLRKNKVIPDERYDDAYREYVNAQSRLNTLAARLKKHTITAPFNGQLGARRVSVGDYVSVGQGLVHLEDLSIVKAEFYVPERYLGALRTSQTVRVKGEALAKAYEGLIYLIDPKISTETRSAVVRARIPNQDIRLRPGMFCTVQIVLSVKDNGLMVPQEALFSQGEKQFIYISKNGTAEIRAAVPGIFSGGRVEITSGLQPGEAVVVSGIQKIMPGAQLIDETPPKN